MGLTYLSVSEYNAILLRNIRMRCVEMNTSIPKIEKALGYGNGAISGWSKAKRYAPMSRIEAVAELLGCTVSDLLGEKEIPASTEASGEDAEFLFKYHRASPRIQAIVRRILEDAESIDAIPGDDAKE